LVGPFRTRTYDCTLTAVKLSVPSTSFLRSIACPLFPHSGIPFDIFEQNNRGHTPRPKRWQRTRHWNSRAQSKCHELQSGSNGDRLRLSFHNGLGESISHHAGVLVTKGPKESELPTTVMDSRRSSIRLCSRSLRIIDRMAGFVLVPAGLEIVTKDTFLVGILGGSRQQIINDNRPQCFAQYVASYSYLAKPITHE
jgi:hypothetical protein